MPGSNDAEGWRSTAEVLVPLQTIGMGVAAAGSAPKPTCCPSPTPKARLVAYPVGLRSTTVLARRSRAWRECRRTLLHSRLDRCRWYRRLQRN